MIAIGMQEVIGFIEDILVEMNIPMAQTMRATGYLSRVRVKICLPHPSGSGVQWCNADFDLREFAMNAAKEAISHGEEAALRELIKIRVGEAYRKLVESVKR